MSECETKFGVGDTVRIEGSHYLRNGVVGRIERQNRIAPRYWMIDFDRDPWPNAIRQYPEEAIVLISKAPQPESLPGGDDCTNRPIADPGFDDLAPAAEADDFAAGFDAEVLEAVLMETLEVLSIAQAAAIDSPPASALAVGLAYRKIESLVEDAREAIRDAKKGGE